MEELRILREQKGYSRRELAELSGVSECEIKNLETGLIKVENASLLVLIKLAKILQCKVIDLIPKDLRKKIR